MGDPLVVGFIFGSAITFLICLGWYLNKYMEYDEEERDT